MSAQNQSTSWFVGSLFIAIPVCLFAIVWNYYAVNVPKWDDHALRNFLYLFDQEKTLSGKLYQLFRQHNEHRIVYDRIVAFLDFQLTGKLNYRHLMAIGNLSLVGLLAVFIGPLRRVNRPLIYAVPVALLLFNLSHWENMFWGMAALQNFSVVLWVILSIYWLTYTNQLGLAIVSALLATLTSGNGLLIWPIGFMLLLLQTGRPLVSNASKTRFPLLIWLISATLVLVLYFVGYEKPAGNPPSRGTLLELGQGWLAFLGAFAEALPTPSPLRTSTYLGGLIALLTVGLVVWEVLVNRIAIGATVRQLINSKTSSRMNKAAIPASTLFFWGCVAFLVGTAAVVAWSRTGFGIDLLLTSRYKIYALTLLATLYVHFAVTVNDQLKAWVLVAGLGVSFVIYWFSTLSFLDDSMWFRHWQTTNQFNWTYTVNGPIASQDSTTLHYTDPAPAFYDALLPVLYGPARQLVVPVTVTKTGYGYSVETSRSPVVGLPVPAPFERDAGTYFLVRSPRRSYLFPVWQHQRSVLQARFWPGNLFTTGFRADVWQSELEAGTYQVFILNVSASHVGEVYPTNQLITSAGQPTAIKKNW